MSFWQPSELESLGHDIVVRWKMTTIDDHPQTFFPLHEFWFLIILSFDSHSVVAFYFVLCKTEKRVVWRLQASTSRAVRAREEKRVWLLTLETHFPYFMLCLKCNRGESFCVIYASLNAYACFSSRLSLFYVFFLEKYKNFSTVYIWTREEHSMLKNARNARNMLCASKGLKTVRVNAQETEIPDLLCLIKSQNAELTAGTKEWGLENMCKDCYLGTFLKPRQWH